MSEKICYVMIRSQQEELDALQNVAETPAPAPATFRNRVKIRRQPRSQLRSRHQHQAPAPAEPGLLLREPDQVELQAAANCCK